MPQSLKPVVRVSVGLALAMGSLVAVASAQTPHQLVSILTDQSILEPSNRFGAPNAVVTNDAGDIAFSGLRGTALFYRKANAISISRVIQFGDEVPGLPGSRLAQVSFILMNANGAIAVRADVYITSRLTHAILLYDGTTLHTIASGLDVAPGTGGQKYERGMTLLGINNTLDVLFASTLVPLGTTNAAQPTIFLSIGGGAPTRIAGFGDTATGMGGGTFTNMNVNSNGGFNDSRQVLINGAITGGTGASGLFVWASGSLRKVAAAGDSNPVGGTFSQDFTNTGQFLNATGLVMFVANNSLFMNTLADGTTVAVAAGSAVPAPMGGTFGTFTNFAGLSAGGDAVFIPNVAGGSGTTGLFRFRSGTGVDVVARLTQAVPGQAGKTFQSFTAVSVNASGAVSFQGNFTNGGSGIFQKLAGGALASAAISGDPTPIGGNYVVNGFGTSTIANNAIIVRMYIDRGFAFDSVLGHLAVFKLLNGVSTALMTTGDDLPAGAREIVRPFFVTAAGDWVGVDFQKAGGRESLAAYNPGTQQGTNFATDGDAVSGALQFNTVTTVQVNSSGMTVAQGIVAGGGGPFVHGIILAGNDVTFGPIVQDGQTDSNGRQMQSVQLASLGARPVSINAAGTVVFTALFNSNRGVWVGTANGTPTKVAINGDLTSTGAAITSINAVHGGINDAGQVLFTANTAAGQGLWVATPGGTPLKVAQVGDAAPGGGSFSGFGTTPMPSFNNLGQVAFVATVSTGPGAGIYLATPAGGGTSYSLEAVALNGGASPAGGTFNITVARPDVVINDIGHVAFISDLAGGIANSGVFVRRGALASIQTVAVQGQPAPGAAGNFGTFAHGANGFVGETFSVSGTGQIAFYGTVTPSGGSQLEGYWHVETDGSIQSIVLAPSTAAAFDGGTAALLQSMSGWMSNDRYPVVAHMANGPNTSGLYLYVPTSGTSTGTGTNVVVTPADSGTGGTAQVTFSNVSAPGVTTLTRSAAGFPLRRGWYITSGSTFYDISTTATYTGPVTVCVDLTDFDPPPNAVMALLHYETGTWVDVTSSHIGSTLCGTSSSLSPFVVAIAMNETPTNIVQNGTFAAGTTNWLPFATNSAGAQDNSLLTFAVNNGVLEYYRAAGSGSGVMLQNTGVTTIGIDQPLVARFDIGNSTSVRKRISVLIHASDFSDLSVCTFYLAPNTPMKTYAMRTHTTKAWTAGASISFYAASAGNEGGGVYQLDNVVMGVGSDLGQGRTDCVDPGQPGVLGISDGPSMLTNGDFSTGDLTGWTPFGTITAQVTNGVAQFIRPSNTAPSGVLLQATGVPVASGQVVTATFQLANSSGVRKRVTVLLHDFTFGDLAACTFWLPAGQPLSTYMMRTYTTQAWSSATISFYPATTDVLGWFELDNVTLKATPSVATYGSDCLEPGGDSILSGAPVAPTAPDQTFVLALPVQDEIDRRGGWERRGELSDGIAKRRADSRQLTCRHIDDKFAELDPHERHSTRDTPIRC